MVDAGDKDILQYEDENDNIRVPPKKSKKSKKSLENFLQPKKLSPEEENSIYRTRLQITSGYEQLFRNIPKLGEDAIKKCLEESEDNIKLYIRTLQRTLAKYFLSLEENYPKGRLSEIFRREAEAQLKQYSDED